MEVLAVTLAVLVMVLTLRSTRVRSALRRPLRRVLALRTLPRRLGLVRPPPPQPLGRPIEEIVRDVRRLGHRWHTLPHGASFAKVEGLRRAYDGALAEACAALGVVHLLTVLAVGDDLDQERRRVETLLHIWGIELDEAA